MISDPTAHLWMHFPALQSLTDADREFRSRS